jgi:hypothetical protein
MSQITPYSEFRRASIVNSIIPSDYELGREPSESNFRLPYVVCPVGGGPDSVSKIVIFLVLVVSPDRRSGQRAATMCSIEKSIPKGRARFAHGVPIESNQL